jgi:midasin (ATPase involved in ribosome maturation)
LVSLDQELPEDIGEFIEVWVDKSMEYNSLFGNYVCTERFGEFVWMKGPLVYALEKGIVLVMNNFQQASNELVVAVKNIVNNGYLYVQNLGQNVYAKLGFKMLGIANQPIFNITSVNEPRKNPLELIPQDMPHYSREYFTELLEKHQQLGFRKLQKLWRRVSYRRKQLL